MTNSMIPYTFTPGTKAKANEINANFVSLANYIEQNKNSATNDVKAIETTLQTKADKSELVNDYVVSEADTDLNDYKTQGRYIFSTLYKPTNIPKADEGMLIVVGDENSIIKQIWICKGENPEIFTRNSENSAWSEWVSTTGILSKTNPGYFKLPNGLIFQWGFTSSSGNVTYPIAYSTFACPVCTKNGIDTSTTRSDTGLASWSLTGFSLRTCGSFWSLNWYSLGY